MGFTLDAPPIYTNVAISGLAGTGSTTLLKKLRATLEPYGWTGYSGGEYMRQFAPNVQGLAHHAASAYPEKVDYMLDMKIREELTINSNVIIESWLAGFLAQGIPHVLKVMVICSDDLARADRLAVRDEMTPQEAFVKAFHRLQTNFERWSRMYEQEWQDWVIQPGTLPANVKISFYNPKLYDLVIDTAAYNQEQTANMVLDQLHMPVLAG